GREAAQEIAGGGGVGDALGPQDVKVGLVGTQPLEVVDGLAAGEEVGGEIEDVIGFVVGDVPFEQAEPRVEVAGELQALDEELDGAEAGGVEARGLVGDLIVDAGGLEHGPALVVPLLFAEAVLDAPLAITEPALYLGAHLKYLHPWEKDCP